MGQVADSATFYKHYCRCAIMLGIPNVEWERSSVLTKTGHRLEYLKSWTRLMHSASCRRYVTWSAMRRASFCVGRCVQDESDYTVVIFADSHYGKHEFHGQLAPWIQSSMRRVKGSGDK